MTEESVITAIRFAVPLCAGLHMMEEFAWPGGFREWYHLYRPQVSGASRSYYYKANAVYFAGALLVSLFGDPGSVLIASGILFCNLIFTHILGAIRTQRYSPGIVTGIVLYTPLFLVSYSYFLMHHLISNRGALICLLVSPLLEIFFAMKRVPGGQTA